MITETTNTKFEQLKKNLNELGCLAVAFSGGVDSTFLVKAASEILGPENVVALTVESPIMAPDEIAEARRFCEELGVHHIVVDGSGYLSEDAFINNPPDRCYHCKKKTFTELSRVIAEINSGSGRAHGMQLADGTNVDDMDDYRPGMRALEELGIISPLRDAGYTKAEIRAELKAREMNIWDKPACACLASRVPYGQSVTAKKMAMIYKAEKALHELGFTQVRVRCHGEKSVSDAEISCEEHLPGREELVLGHEEQLLGRIEVLPEERKLFYSDEMMDKVSRIMADAGFAYSALDLGGYVMGNMNQKIL